MRDLPLSAAHRALGATFQAAAGWSVPARYESEESEQRAVRAAVGIIDWTPRGAIRLTGEDRLEFLDNLVTNDVQELGAGDGVYAATLDHKGRVQGDMVVYRDDDGYLLETEPGTERDVLAHFEKLLVSEDVVLEDVTGSRVVLGVAGPASAALVGDAFGEPPSEPYGHRPLPLDGGAGRLARNPYFGGDGFELWVPPGTAAGIWTDLVERGAVPFGARAAEALRIEAGRPKFGVDMDPETLALEARLEPAISFTKGCYVGQEVISRATYVGHVNRLLVGMRLSGDPPPAGTSVRADGRDVGRVTSAARSATLGATIALGYVQRASAGPGTRVTVGSEPGTVADLPFVR